MTDLGYRTDLMIIGFEGEVYDRGHYHVGRSPRSPDWFWGNLLVFDEPPGRWALHEWTEAFRREFADLPRVRHQAFGWRSPSGAFGAVEPFERVGFTRFRCEVLATEATRLPKRAAEHVQLRPATSDEDWQQVERLQRLVRPATISEVAWEPFLGQRMASLRRLGEAGHGALMGAFDGDEMVGCLGIYAHQGLARYQSVVVATAHRGRGVAGSLVAGAGAWAQAALGARRQVIIADAGAAAARLYRRAGFEQVGWQVGVLRRPGTV